MRGRFRVGRARRRSKSPVGIAPGDSSDLAIHSVAASRRIRASICVDWSALILLFTAMEGAII